MKFCAENLLILCTPRPLQRVCPRQQFMKFLCLYLIGTDLSCSVEVTEEINFPKIFLVSGENIRCMESSAVLLEYEVWHVDPQDAVYVSMYLSHLGTQNEILQPRQTLISMGGLPAGELMLSRLRHGHYLVELELFEATNNTILAAGRSSLGQILLYFDFNDGF